MNVGSDQLNEVYRQKLCKDKVFSTLPLQEQNELIGAAVAAGRQMAHEVSPQLASIDFIGISAWLSILGIHVEKLDTKYQLPYIAEYEELKKKITLYSSRIRQIEDTLRKESPDYFETHSLDEMCLLHECFHHLESRKFKTTGRIIGKTVKALGLIPVCHYFPEGSEIAAHEFVSEMLSLPFSTYTFVDEAVEAWKIEKERKLCQQSINAQ